jgi:hypothetical protein
MSTADDDVTSISPSEAPAVAGVRWKRFGGMLALTTIATGALVTLTAQGVLAANFSISGMPFTVTATHLHGVGFEQFATLDNMIDNSPNQGNTGGQMVLIVSAIDSADLTSLCQSVDLGGMSLKITAGDAGSPVHGDSLVVDSDDIQGNADFQNINVGQDASTFDKVKDRTKGSGNIKGNPGVFGQQADIVDIYNLRQNNYATTAARFTLPHLHMSFTSGGC